MNNEQDREEWIEKRHVWKLRGKREVLVESEDAQIRETGSEGDEGADLSHLKHVVGGKV